MTILTRTPNPLASNDIYYEGAKGTQIRSRKALISSTIASLLAGLYYRVSYFRSISVGLITYIYVGCIPSHL